MSGHDQSGEAGGGGPDSQRGSRFPDDVEDADEKQRANGDPKRRQDASNAINQAFIRAFAEKDGNFGVKLVKWTVSCLLHGGGQSICCVNIKMQLLY